MAWLWILGAILILLLLLCATRVGARVRLTGGALSSVDVKVGLFHFRVFPGKPKTVEQQAKADAKKAEKAAKKARKEAKKPAGLAQRDQTGEKKKSKLRIGLADIKDAVRTLWPPLKRALARFGRGIRVHPLDLSLTVGGRDDPANAAQLYGCFHAGMWAAMPVLEKLADIPDPRIHLELDFDAPGIIPEGEAGISIRIGTLLAMAFGVGIPALRWFLRFRKKMKTKQQAAPRTTEQAA